MGSCWPSATVGHSDEQQTSSPGAQSQAGGRLAVSASPCPGNHPHGLTQMCMRLCVFITDSISLFTFCCFSLNSLLIISHPHTEFRLCFPICIPSVPCPWGEASSCPGLCDPRVCLAWSGCGPVPVWKAGQTWLPGSWPPTYRANASRPFIVQPQTALVASVLCRHQVDA